jgi:DmsE family decaheme c-type cytochrome
MHSRSTLACITALLLLGLWAAAGAQQNPYRLKEPDQKKLCVTCHSDFEQTLKKRVVHAPVSGGDCAGCHDPHVSSHGKLLSTDTSQLCASCHDGVVPAKAASVHKVAADGQCTKCHDPHASDNAGMLVAKGDDLCVTCHKALGDAVAKAKFKHSPVQQGCVSCHDPHGSAQSAHLLKSGVPGLCVGCHKPDTTAFAARHMNYPVGKGACTSCHDPHGSNQAALLLDNVHQPVATRACVQCHEAADSATPLATKRPGYELCKGCHNDMVTATFAKGRLHWPVADRQGCANCHNPHASREPKLLKAESATLCASCHADTVKRIAAATSQHAPVKDGQCVSCHSPHASSGAYLVDQPSLIELCTTCHDYKQHSAHPIGAEAVDPRNPNLRVDCQSCHKGHGTNYKHMLLNATNLELCTQCHKQYGR